MYRWIDSTGNIIKTKTIKDFALTYNFDYSMAKSLACGLRSRLNGFCSTSPRAKKHRKRFTTRLINTRTREEAILGSSIVGFAKQRNLCANEIWKLVNRYQGKLMYRDWCLL